MHRFNKLNFIFLAVALLITPLALNAQAKSSKWTGVHVGVIGGTAAGNENWHVNESGTTGDIDYSLSGGRFGVNGGVDFNVKGLVVGGLVDWSWANAQFREGVSSNGTSADLHFKLKQLTTVRARVGRNYGHVLPYVHGGLLIADHEVKTSGSSGGITIPLLGNQSNVRAGFVVGAGVEYFLHKHYSMTTEYGFNHVGGFDLSNILGGTTNGTENIHFNAITVGFNYHF